MFVPSPNGQHARLTAYHFRERDNEGFIACGRSLGVEAITFTGDSAMNPLRRYPVLSSLLRPFRLSQQKTCASMVAALCQAAQASSFAIAGQLSCLTEVQFGSALTRLYRFLRNPRFDDWLLTEQMLRLLGDRQGRL